MRHRVKKNHFNRKTKHRQSMLRTMVRNLLTYGSLKTTQAKAKEIKRITDKLICTAQAGDLNARRQLHTFFGKRDAVNTLVDKIAPLYKDRKSGFTTMSVLGKRRGDNSIMVELELIKKPEETGSLRKAS